MKFEFPTHNSKELFKFQGHDSDLEYIFLETWRFDKPIALSEKSLFVVPTTKTFFKSIELYETLQSHLLNDERPIGVIKICIS